MLPLYLAVAYYLILTRLIPGIYYKWKRRCQLTLPRRLVLFTRYPSPETTKTRMIPALGSVGAAQLQLLMTNHILSILKNCSQTLSNLCIEVRYYGGTEENMDYWLNTTNSQPLVVYRKQEGENLGARMSHAMSQAMNEGAKQVLIVGSDIPGITSEVLQEGFKLLEKEGNECDVILGPAADGGYYTIGASSINTRQHLGELFKGMDWGTERVLQQQVEAGESFGLKIKLLSQTLFDVDTEEDLSIVKDNLDISKDDLLYPHWSIVIPILNEAHNLEKVMKSLVENADFPDRLEIVLADGGSTDDTNKVVQQLQNELRSTGVTLKLITCSEKGRGIQLNEGAAATSHKLLMFIHADSQLPLHYDKKAWRILHKPGVSAGAFHFGLDILHNNNNNNSSSSSSSSSSKGEKSLGTGTSDGHFKASWWFLQQMKLLEWGTRKRSINYELPYGDQGLFLWRRVFNKVGGYPSYRLMEDYEMISKLKKEGHIGFVEGGPLLTSARRWQKHGYLKITGMNTFIIAAYKCNVHPNTLARWYYGQ